MKCRIDEHKIKSWTHKNKRQRSNWEQKGFEVVKLRRFQWMTGSRGLGGQLLPCTSQESEKCWENHKSKTNPNRQWQKSPENKSRRSAFISFNKWQALGKLMQSVVRYWLCWPKKSKVVFVNLLLGNFVASPLFYLDPEGIQCFVSDKTTSMS